MSSIGQLRYWACLVIAALAACKADPHRSDKPAQGSSATADHPRPDIWFQGSPEQAFEEARARNKLVFLYWGAAWCPPCAALKSDVFEKGQFAELMRSFVPVYLDGDTERAQRLGEALGASAYPTMLVLSADREELLRLSGVVDMGEFEQAMRAVLGASGNFKAARRRLSEGSLDASDLRILAYTGWEQLPDRPESRVALLKKAFEKCPRELAGERAIFAATLLSFAAIGRDSEGDIKVRSALYLDAIFADASTVWAARSFVNMRAGEVTAWLDGDTPGKDHEALKKRWLAAASMIRGREDASIDTRLWSVKPALDLFRREQPDGPLPDALRAEVERAVAAADEKARSAHDRHAVIAGAAYLLRRVGAHERARTMMIAEAERSDTPFYYYTSLSALEQELGRVDAAREWSAKARRGSAGRATRLQWIANDILLNAKLEGPSQRPYLLSLTEELFAVAFELGDGFSGRNRSRLVEVGEALRASPRDKDAAAAVFAKYRARCVELAAESRASCQQYFDDQVR